MHIFPKKYAIILFAELVLSRLIVAPISANAAESSGYNPSSRGVSAPEPNIAASPDLNAPSGPGLRLRPTSTTLPKAPEALFSPSASQLFYDIAYEMIHRKDITDSQAEQAIVLLQAADNLDTSNGFVPADILTIASRPGPPRHLKMLYDALIKYTDKNADYLVATNAIRYILQQLDSRQQKEMLLGQLIKDIGESNPCIKSELITTLGLLYAEKADDFNATTAMAMAYSSDKYNRLAFEKLVELVPEQISPVLNLEYLRTKLRENPLDLATATAFAQYAQRVQLYEVAAGTYEYCSDLFQYLYPGQNIPTGIYLDWMTCCYNVPRSRPRCPQLAEQFRKQGVFNLQMEVLAARAALKTQDTAIAQQMLKNAEQKAVELAEKSGPSTDYETLAWFYCFIKPDINKAIDYANKAYSNEPNSPLAAALLACAFADNNQPKLAKPLVENYPQTQIATLVAAKLQLADGQKQQAVDTLRAAIDKDPGSIVAEQAQILLAGQNAEYIPIFDTGLILSTLKQKIGEQVVPQFVRPDQILSFQLNIRGNRFSYGNDIAGVVSITNKWYEPLVISDDGLCKGRIVINADITGDLQARFEKIVVTTTRPTTPIEAGQSALVPVRLSTGPLKALLANHPQASLNIKFTAYLDPIVTRDGNIINSVSDIKPAIVEIERPRVEITNEFLQNRLNSVSKGKQGPKIKAAELFAGLLMEIREMDNRQPPYKMVREDWLTPMLKSGMTHSLTDSDWVVRAHSLAAIKDLPLDYELTSAASEGLNDQHWPSRMLAMWLLAPKQGYNFIKVLDHAAQYDDSEFVRNMAVALGAKVPEQNKPVQQSLLELLKQEPNTSSQSPLAPSASPAGLK